MPNLIGQSSGHYQNLEQLARAEWRTFIISFLRPALFTSGILAFLLSFENVNTTILLSLKRLNTADAYLFNITFWD